MSLIKEINLGSDQKNLMLLGLITSTTRHPKLMNLSVSKKGYITLTINCVYLDTTQGEEDKEGDVDPNQYDQTETYFIKLTGEKTYDMKIEHFDDMI